MKCHPITHPQAERIAVILKEECGWRGDDEAFVCSIIVPRADGKPACSEYRFIGALGFGGKFRNNGNNNNTPYVDYYPEHNTPERAAMVARANARLKSLFEPTVSPTARACAEALNRHWAAWSLWPEDERIEAIALAIHREFDPPRTV